MANTITRIDIYLDDLAKLQKMGYALDNGENEFDGRRRSHP